MVKQMVGALVSVALVLAGTSTALAVPNSAVPNSAPPTAVGTSQAGQEISISKVRLMGAKKINVVRNVWTTIDVTVTNTGDEDLDGPIVLTGAGKGMVAKKVTKDFSLWAGESVPIEMKVRLKGKRKKAPFRVTVVSDGVSARTSVRVTKVKAPARPKPGRYVSPNGKVRFTVTKKHKIKNFKGTQQLQCGVWPQYTYQTQTHSFPLTNVPRSGRIDRHVNASNDHYYELEMFVRGKRATKGYFWVNGGYCTGSMKFTARRVR